MLVFGAEVTAVDRAQWRYAVPQTHTLTQVPFLSCRSTALSYNSSVYQGMPDFPEKLTVRQTVKENLILTEKLTVPHLTSYT